VAAQATRPAATESPKVKPGRVHFEDIAQQSGLNALNVYGGIRTTNSSFENTGNGAVLLVVSALTCLTSVLLGTGVAPMWALVLPGFFHSIMFPTMFSLSLKRLAPPPGWAPPYE
jgi:hypothetical protein